MSSTDDKGDDAAQFQGFTHNVNNGEKDTETAGMLTMMMTLTKAREVLEQQAFRCTTLGDDNKSIVGVVSKCDWGMSAKIDTMVFVHHVDGDLTLDRLESDVKQLPDLVQDHYLGGCPPFGFGRGRIVIVVYLTDKDVETAAMNRILAVPKKEWCTGTFLAAQDGKGVSHYLPEHMTPFWGRVFYPEMRYLAGLLTGRRVERPEKSRMMPVVNVVLCLYLLFMGISDPWAIWLMATLLPVWFVVATVLQWCRHLRSRSKKRGALLEEGMHAVEYV